MDSETCGARLLHASRRIPFPTEAVSAMKAHRRRGTYPPLTGTTLAAADPNPHSSVPSDAAARPHRSARPGGGAHGCKQAGMWEVPRCCGHVGLSIARRAMMQRRSVPRGTACTGRHRPRCLATWGAVCTQAGHQRSGKKRAHAHTQTAHELRHACANYATQHALNLTCLAPEVQYACSRCSAASPRRSSAGSGAAAWTAATICVF